MRRLAATALCALALPAAASAADRSWAQPQIETVVEAGLLADDVATFKPQRPLTQRALGAALETLSFANDEPVGYSYPVVVPGRAVTIRELDAALIGFLGLGDAARSITAALRDAGLQPKAGAGSETIARLLGLRLNHPAYPGGGWFVHSSGNGIILQPFEGWYRDRFAWARRPLREAGLG